MAFDNSTSYTTYASTLTYSHTVGTGSNRRLWVTVAYTGSGDKITGVTYGGVSLTRLQYTNVGSAAVLLYELDAPSSGAANVVVSTTGAGSYSTAAVSADDVSGATVSDKSVSAFVSSPLSQSLSVNSGDLVFDFANASTDIANTFSPGAGQTQDESWSGAYHSTVSHKTAASTGTTTMEQSWSGGDQKTIQRCIWAVGQSSGGGGGSSIPAIFNHYRKLRA